MPEPAYLGDGVEATYDGYHLTLTADRTKVVHLEPSVFAALIRYAVTSGWADPQWVREIIDGAAKK